MDDTSIIELFFKRDEQALKAVEKKYGGLCFSIANNIIRSRTDAEECVNDTYLAAWNSIPPEKPNKLSAYLAKIARNKALHRYKLNTSEKRGGTEYEQLLSELAEDVAAKDKTDDTFNEHFLTSVINDYLRSVPKSKASIFIQRYFWCFEIDEISENTGKSYNSVNTTLCRMRKDLKKRLEKEGIDL